MTTVPFFFATAQGDPAGSTLGRPASVRTTDEVCGAGCVVAGASTGSQVSGKKPPLLDPSGRPNPTAYPAFGVPANRPDVGARPPASFYDALWALIRPSIEETLRGR